MKKALKIVGVLFGLSLVLAIAIPFFVNVDQYRPQIIEAAESNINGKLELGKLSLSLWGQIRVQIEGLTLKDTTGKTIVSVKDAFFQIPLSSVLGGSPLLTLGLKSPEIFVVKDRAGKLNVLGIAKPSTAAATTSAPQKSVAIPAMVANARLGAKIENAVLSYQDEGTGLKSTIKDLQLTIKDLSLSRPTEVELIAQIDTEMAGAKGVAPSTIKGPAKVELKSELRGGGYDHLAVELKVNLDDLEINMPGTFQKKKGIPARAEGKFETSPEEAKIQKLEIRFHNAEVSATGEVGQPNGAKNIKFTAKSNDIELKSWTEILPSLKAYELGGLAHLEVSAQGPADKLGYRAQFEIKGLTAKAPHLKAQPQFDVMVSVVTDQIEKMSFTMKAPGNDLKITGKLISFTQPQADFEITSTGMDLDSLIDFPPPAQSGATAAPSANSKGGTAPQGKTSETKAPTVAEANYDQLLDPLRTNPIAAKTRAEIRVAIQSIKVQGMKMTDIKSKLTLNDLNASLENFAMKLWDGTIKMNLTAALKPATPTYRFGADFSGLKLEQASSSKMEFIKNTVIGTAHFKMDGTGASFNPAAATRQLRAKGNLKVDNAKFTTIDVTKMATDGVNQAIDKIAEKIPAAKGKGVKPPGNRESRYDFISSDFTIEGGKFTAPNFMTKAASNNGIDLKGFTQVGLEDHSLKANWELIDTFNLTHARDVSVNQAGVEIPHLLAEGNNPVKFPVSAGGTIQVPTYSYTQVGEYLVGIALKNVAGAATGRAKAEAQKAVQEAVKNNAPPALQNAIQGFGKKLFGK